MSTARLKSLLNGYLRRRFAWLFFALLVAIGIHPVFKTIAPDVSLMGGVLAVSLFAAIASAARERGFRALITFGLAFVAFYALRVVFGGEAVLLIGEFVWVLTCVLAMAALAREAFRRGTVDSERIFAALDAYLMAGLIFSVCYLILEQSWPASFGTPAVTDLDLSGAVYFSFVTIATLGYGDITPASEAARGLAILEAVAGQLYIAVLVARLVGLYTVSASDRADT